MSNQKTYKPKYLAEGFDDDAKKILIQFAQESSVEFAKFAEIWKKNHFSLIFMGRPDKVETSEFTNEIFRISLHYLSSPSFYQRVGSVYLLYALYRNQIADTPIKIRIDIAHWTTIKHLHTEATINQYRTLHYVIDYLTKYAFTYVANQTLKGPLTGVTVMMSEISETLSNFKKVYKCDVIEYSMQNSLKALRDLHSQYLEGKQNLGSHINLNLMDTSEVYNDFMSELDNLVNPSQKAKQERSESLGSRRAKIKAESFLRRAKDRFGYAIEEDGCETSQDPDLFAVTTKRRGSRPRRVPKHERRVGRPSKKPQVQEISVQEKSDDENINFSRLIDQQNELYLPPEEQCKKMKCKPGKFYYKLSPKRERSDDSS